MNKVAPKSAANPVREVRLVKLVNILQRGRPISRQDLEQQLEVSRATLTRDIAVLRDQLNMPIAYDREAEGYVLAQPGDHPGPRYELPGVWLSVPQIYAVLALTNIVMSIGPGFLRQKISPLRYLAKQIVGLPTDRPPPFDQKVSFELPRSEDVSPAIFQTLSEALLSNNQVMLQFSGKPSIAHRFSLLRFVLTTQGWRLDGFSEESKTVVRISTEAIAKANILDMPATQLQNWDNEWQDEQGQVISAE